MTIANLINDDGTVNLDHPSRHVPEFVPLNPRECLGYRADDVTCDGPVEYHLVGLSLRAWPRCTKHLRERLDLFVNSIEREAMSSVAPSWFDPSYAGESWDE